MKTITYLIPKVDKTIGGHIIKAQNRYEIVGEVTDYYFIWVNGSQVVIQKGLGDLYYLEIAKSCQGGDTHNEYERTWS